MIRSSVDSPAECRVDVDRRRRLGPVGTWSRVVVGAALVVGGFLHGYPWGIEWYEVVLGLVALPALVVTVALVVGRCTSGPVRLTGCLAMLVNCAAIVALATNPVTGTAIDLFYGATLLAGAWRSQPGCEVTVLSNWILRRDDEIGCPIFSPIDQTERRYRARHLTA